MCLAFLTVAITLLGTTPKELSSRRVETATLQQARTAVEKSLVFLRTDAVAWREKANCATCHHGALTATVFSEARSRGYAVEEPALQDMLIWTKGRFVPEYEVKPHLTDGFQIPSLAMPLLTLSLWTKPDALTREDIDRMTKYILDRQEADGGWPLQPHNPHPVFDSRETLNIWFYLALEASARGEGERAAAARAAREKVLNWLSTTPPADTTQSAALRLLINVRDRRPRRILNRQIGELLRRQNPDGGWSQIKELASDAYATGQALYVLSLAGAKGDRQEIQRGVAFLVSTQREDASWPMMSRETPDRKAAKNLLPIIHFGTAWATLGLIRSLPKNEATPSRQISAGRE